MWHSVFRWKQGISASLETFSRRLTCFGVFFSLPAEINIISQTPESMWCDEERIFPWSFQRADPIMWGGRVPEGPGPEEDSPSIAAESVRLLSSTESFNTKTLLTQDEVWATASFLSNLPSTPLRRQPCPAPPNMRHDFMTVRGAEAALPRRGRGVITSAV